MNSRHSKRVATVLVIAVIAALAGWRIWKQGSPRPIDREYALGQLKSQAEEFRLALLAEDFSRVADLSHPKCVPQDDQNRRQFIGFRQNIANAGRENGEAVVLDIVLVSTSLEETNENVYACIEIKKEFKPTPVQGSSFQPIYWIAVSSDRGETWKFIESTINRDSLEARFPDFPKKLQLPSPQLRVWRNDAERGAADDRPREGR